MTWMRVFVGGMAVVGTACGSTPEDDLATSSLEIKNGQAAGNGQLAAVKLWIELDRNDGVSDQSYVVTCSGEIIASDTIVTAAHCFRGNTPTADRRWWSRVIPVRVGAKAATGEPFTPMTLDSSGNWAYRSAVVRIHPNFVKFGPPVGLEQLENAPYDIATVTFTLPSSKPVPPPPFAFPGFTSASQVPWLDNGGTGTTYNGFLFGYGTDGGTTDFRAGFFSCSKGGGFYSCNNNPSTAQGCSGDSGGPLIAGASLGIPRHQFGVFFASLCSGDTSASGENWASPIRDNLSFVIGPLSGAGRCTTQTFTAQTPPPQSTKILTRCF